VLEAATHNTYHEHTNNISQELCVRGVGKLRAAGFGETTFAGAAADDVAGALAVTATGAGADADTDEAAYTTRRPVIRESVSRR
jgi:hypothetical protein